MSASTSARAKILYCENCQDGTVGGSHHCLLQLVENLDRSLYEPIVIFHESHVLLPKFQAAAETHVCEPPMAARWKMGARWSKVSVPLVLIRRAVNLVWFMRTVGKYIAFLRRNRIALVHLNNSITRQHEWICAAFLARIPCVVSERGINQRYTVLDRTWARRLSLIVPVSCWIMDHMIQRGVAPDNIRALYDGLDVSKIKIARSAEVLLATYGVQPHQPVVGIVGNIREWKGQETVVRALIEVVKAYPNVVCFFVGAATAVDKLYQDRLNALIRQAGIEGNVRFTGYQPDPASFVNIMKLVIHASVLPEPFGMVLLEGMAQRKAVIGSRAGGVIEIVVEGETGYTFPPGDSATLSAKIIELLDKPDQAAEMGEKGYKRLMSSFTLQHYMDEIHTAYSAILGKRAVPDNVGILPK